MVKDSGSTGADEPAPIVNGSEFMARPPVQAGSRASLSLPVGFLLLRFHERTDPDVAEPDGIAVVLEADVALRV